MTAPGTNTHALVRTLAARNVPAWLNEGMPAEADDLDWAQEMFGLPMSLKYNIFRRLTRPSPGAYGTLPPSGGC